ncbi:MAG: aromatic-ring-hydroxylating dioxygenase subunit beta [Pigmentiphaga sp.]|uniref:aromatic-ring-hydroxylating dioxygenase subunit beta n=1 Tax=Pigmentiphaga sp. TaxID=1977564 RepID=UPI0029A84254|nr:aromatic-ring-hydroxylating dioxygenase subunit beta [Pigmentiphaga sp.]MDX3904185.1 aromatic-ring-hydroxylating dioxygenase subunit beta [Pigmentiphaga sp.]
MLQDISQFIFREAKLLDDRQYEAWLDLFEDDGMYVVPLTEEDRPGRQAAIVCDNKMAREERVHHLVHHWFPAQQPPSRTLHFISNVVGEEREGAWHVSTSQMIYEMRAGDWFQVGLGEVRPIVARVEYILPMSSQGFRIREKRILMLDRAGWQRNLAFIY